jgi:hypothetical protein
MIPRTERAEQPGSACVCVRACGAVGRRFRSVTKTQILEGWKHFLSEVAVPLLALETNSEDEQAAARIRQLAAEASHLMKYSGMFAPDTYMVAAQVGGGAFRMKAVSQ